MKNIFTFEKIMKGIVLSTALVWWSICIAIPLLMCIYFVIYSLIMNFFATLSSFLPILS